MAKLNQIIAVEKGIKSRSFQELTEAHQALQKPAQLAGISRTYRPKDEEGEVFPPESTKVQIKAEDIVRQTVEVLTKLFDATATKDWTNCRARADVVVDGNVPAAMRQKGQCSSNGRDIADGLLCLTRPISSAPCAGTRRGWCRSARAGRRGRRA